MGHELPSVCDSSLPGWLLDCSTEHPPLIAASEVVDEGSLNGMVVVCQLDVTDRNELVCSPQAQPEAVFNYRPVAANFNAELI